MSNRPKLDATALAAAMGERAVGGQPPTSFDRAGRIRLIGAAAQALLKGEKPEAEAALFLGGALLEWLQRGGSLERDFLRVVAPKSHITPAVVWQRLNAHPDEPSS